MVKIMVKKMTTTRRGYTLLFAVLTASLVLGVATFVVGVARKQYIISATARDSMFSFYNADSAIGCITQSWNNSTSTPAAKCAGYDLTTIGFIEKTAVSGVPNVFHDGTTLYGKTYSTQGSGMNGGMGIYTNLDLAGCALTQIWVGTNSSGDLAMVYESRGYNTCDAGGPAPSRRTVERAIRVTQQ